MKTKLTLRLDNRLIQHAKSHARRTGKSVSRLVADYFVLFDQRTVPGDELLPPVTKALYGALAQGQVDRADYYKHLEEKYR